MRGFGAVQVCFAHEGQMDKLAAALAMDPVELRLRNAAAPGTVLPTGQVIRGAAPVREVIERTAAIPLLARAAGAAPRRDRAPRGRGGQRREGEGIRRGVGFAVGYKNHGYSGGFDDYADARVTLGGAGGPVAEIPAPRPRWGRASRRSWRRSRTVLGVERVILRTSDTFVGSAGSTSASRQTLVSGGAVKAASEAVLAELLERARRDAKVAGADLGVDGGFVTADGEPVMAVDELLGEPIERSVIWRYAGPRRRSTKTGRATCTRGSCSPPTERSSTWTRSWGSCASQLATAQDVGFAINPQSVVGRSRAARPRGRPGAHGGAPARGRTHPQRVVHRLPAADHARHAAGGGRARRGAGTGRAVRREGRWRAGQRRRACRDRLGAPAALGRDLQRSRSSPTTLRAFVIPPWPPFPDEPASEPSPLSGGVFHVGSVPPRPRRNGASLTPARNRR